MNAACDHQGRQRCCPACCAICWCGSRRLTAGEVQDGFFTPLAGEVWKHNPPGIRLATERGWTSFDHASRWGDYDTNAHGIHGFWRQAFGTHYFVPMVCDDCPLREVEGDDYTTWTFCGKGVYLPVQKGTCRVKEQVLTSQIG